ncbi:MAG: hypothetical protein K2Y02_06515 [Burkholderiaceae bacterium]|nr:hypothetical protein [Burkholderiaceae bacterium]
MQIDALQTVTRADFRIERGVLGIGYFVRDRHQMSWQQPVVTLDYDSAEAAITTLLRDAERREHERDFMS